MLGLKGQHSVTLSTRDKRPPTQGGRHLYVYGQFNRDFPQILCTWSFHECRRHYSSWEVSRESQSSPLRFFVESIATDHQAGRTNSFTLFSARCHLTSMTSVTFISDFSILNVLLILTLKVQASPGLEPTTLRPEILSLRAAPSDPSDCSLMCFLYL